MSFPIAHITLKHWGNSLAIRIPSAVANALDLKANSRVSMTLEAGRVILEPSTAAIDIDAMVTRITRKNRHHESDTGDAIGNETW